MPGEKNFNAKIAPLRKALIKWCIVLDRVGNNEGKPVSWIERVDAMDIRQLNE